MPDDADIDTENPANEMTFLEHLEEMRGVIIKSLTVFMLAFVVVLFGFYYFNKLMLYPLNAAKEILAVYVGQEQVEAKPADIEKQTLGPVYLVGEGENAQKSGPFYIVPKDDSVVLVKGPPLGNSWVADIKLRSMSITTPILVWLSVGFLGSLGLSLPFIVYFAARFVMPGLTKAELKMLAPGVIVGTVLFFLGACFAFFFMLPMGIAFMAYMSQGMQLEMFPDAMSYYSMVIFLTIATGLTFELPLLQLVLIYLGILNVEWLKKNRRMVILVIVVFAAIVTPPDVITQIALSTPLFLMYEISLRIGIILRRKKLARENAERAAEEAEDAKRDAEYARRQAQLKLEEERVEAEKAAAQGNALPDNGAYEDRAGSESREYGDSDYEELDNLDDDYGLDKYMQELDKPQEGYIDYGSLAKPAADFSPDWSLNAPDISVMSPDWALNETPKNSEIEAKPEEIQVAEDAAEKGTEDTAENSVEGSVSAESSVEGSEEAPSEGGSSESEAGQKDISGNSTQSNN